MRLISFESRGVADWGAQVGDGVVESARLGAQMPATLQGFIEQCEQSPGLLAQTAARAAIEAPAPMAQRRLLPCVPKPGKIVCLGVNYIDHAKEGGNQIGDYPAMFLRCASSLLAHGAPLQVPRISDKLDFEAELAVIIGRTARFVSEAQALNHVFGYACFNDGSLRDYQRRTTQWTIGKNFDATGAFGPALVTADELPPGCVGLRIQSRLNGQVMQDASTADMAFGVARTISLLSECMTLEPGDLIVMGTPGGVGYARTPPVWMKAGDTIEVDIEGVGVLSNRVVA
ncbi:MAG: fumarylacetoacetate hydrolase family protein [Rubrivivax sp.]|nr:fumarylacetoacetate hydrolase family protein [Rubrivivax sp.]MDP3083938.1 fumarylacetoacetate hydrolase family protein [Rubrivivax sp.]